MDSRFAAKVSMGADVERNGIAAADRVLKTRYKVEAYDKQGQLKWTDEFDNLVVDAGLNDSLDKHLKGSSYNAAWYVGITAGSPIPAAGDTMASHVGWTEVEAYDEAPTRPTLTLGEVSGKSVSNAASKAVFTIDTNDTVIGGAFVTSNSATGGSTGILYGVGAFTGGQKQLSDDDVLNVTVTLSASAT